MVIVQSIKVTDNSIIVTAETTTDSPQTEIDVICSYVLPGDQEGINIERIYQGLS